MSAPARTITIVEPPDEELVLPILGRVTVRAVGRGLDAEMRWRARRPLAVNYRAFANATLSASLQPEFPPRSSTACPMPRGAS